MNGDWQDEVEIAIAEQLSEIASTPELQRLLSNASSICPSSQENKSLEKLSHLEPEIKSLEKKRRGARGKERQSGSLFQYLKNTKLKSGQIASYPRLEGQRDPDKVEHWYWGYSYGIKVGGGWKNRSLSVPRSKVRVVRQMLKDKASVESIVAYLSRNKSHR